MQKPDRTSSAAQTSGGTAVPPGNCVTHGYHGRTYCPRCSMSAIPPPPLGQAPTAAYTEEQLRAALIFWVGRARRFEEKLDQFAYMKARGVLSDEYEVGRRVFEESLPTVEDIVGLVPDMNPEVE